MDFAQRHAAGVLLGIVDDDRLPVDGALDQRLAGRDDEVDRMPAPAAGNPRGIAPAAATFSWRHTSGGSR